MRKSWILYGTLILLLGIITYYSFAHWTTLGLLAGAVFTALVFFVFGAMKKEKFK
ncbi:MAG: hypothetical protein ACLFS3_02080 [Candidatus Aenigmatarchaeota archaeon]